MRINKFLATSGIASRRKCDDLIADGKVLVNGKTAVIGQEINEKKDKIEIEGKPINLPTAYEYIKLNKPKGYICSASDELGRKTVYSLIKNSNYRLFTIGRLDYDSEGLIILTNDGDFAERVAHPSYEKSKVYIVNAEGELKESELAVMRAGVVLENGERMPECKIVKKGYKDNVTRLEITINEGQNRQIRRMFEAINREIKMLKRIKIGDVSLGGLSRGEYKPLSAQEISVLLKR